MIRRPPRSTLDRSSAASDVYKRQAQDLTDPMQEVILEEELVKDEIDIQIDLLKDPDSVSYTHLRAHETVLDLVCRLLLEKKKNIIS